MSVRLIAGFIVLLYTVVGLSTASANGLSCDLIFPGDSVRFAGLRPQDPDPAGTILKRFKSLTDSFRKDGHDFGDPSAPDFSQPGVVRIYTTNGEVLFWKDSRHESAKQKFLRGVTPQREHFELFDADGKTGLDPWDPTVEAFAEFGGERFLYAGVMTPPKGQKEARWPEDNWRRRVNAFRWHEGRDGGRWIRVADSMLGDAPDQPTWLDHSYGHQFQRDAQNRLWMFYEKVTEERDGTPWKTEIFMRRVLSPTRLAKKEIPVLKLSEESWPATRRNFGGLLVEALGLLRLANISWSPLAPVSTRLIATGFI